MRRLITFSSIFLLILLCGTTVFAKLSRGDRVKLRRILSVYLSPDADDEKRYEAEKDFNEFFDGRKAKELKSVDELMEVLAGSGDRPKQRKGVLLKQVKLPDGSKFQYVVNVPKRYSGNMESDAWPLILSIPPKGMTAQKYLDTYWASEEIREAYLIAVLNFDYKDVEVEVVKEVQDNAGKVRLETVKEKQPFTWDSTYAIDRFWGSLVEIQLKEFKVNPDRIILDGAGEGADGVLEFASCSAFRFAGVVTRGGTVTEGSVANLKHLRILALPKDGASEESKKSHEAMAKELGANYQVGDPAQVKAWLDATTRQRFPVPTRWVVQGPAQQFGYWCFVSKLHKRNKPAEISIKPDVRKKRLDVEAKNVAEFTIYVNDLLVDMDKPFDLFVNGEKIMEKVALERSPDQILKHAVPRGGVFTNELVDIKIQAPPEEEKKDDEKKPDDEKKGDEKKPDDEKKGDEKKPDDVKKGDEKKPDEKKPDDKKPDDKKPDDKKPE